MAGIVDMRPVLRASASMWPGMELRRMKTDSLRRGQVLAQISRTMTRERTGSR